ncbi:hypothetical protein LEMLEM_LOCUS2766 [Lemmus lemmus]
MEDKNQVPSAFWLCHELLLLLWSQPPVA